LKPNMRMQEAARDVLVARCLVESAKEVDEEIRRLAWQKFVRQYPGHSTETPPQIFHGGGLAVWQSLLSQEYQAHGIAESPNGLPVVVLAEVACAEVERTLVLVVCQELRRPYDWVINYESKRVAFCDLALRYIGPYIEDPDPGRAFDAFLQRQRVMIS